MTAGRDLTVELEHRVGGSPDVVFSYFTDPEKHRRWQGTDVELDPRPGGTYRITYAPQVWVRGEYVTLEPPDRIVLTWGFESTVALPRGLRDVPAGSSTVEFRFIPDGDGTIIKVRHTGLPTQEAHWAHGFGWETYLPRLERALVGDDPGDEPVAVMAEALFQRDAATAAVERA